MTLALLLRADCTAARPVYDVTRRETFESLGNIWFNEVEMYSTIEDAVKMVVANKVDMVRALDGVVF